MEKFGFILDMTLSKHLFFNAALGEKMIESIGALLLDNAMGIQHSGPVTHINNRSDVVSLLHIMPLVLHLALKKLK